ncbi:hypothetical protein [Anaerolentibacter hominis]|uniref:hypothetical protein n=1 Tax=Anaerolentibacter hominis TaxID=3079009 RepID=UPI0031B81264
MDRMMKEIEKLYAENKEIIAAIRKKISDEENNQIRLEKELNEMLGMGRENKVYFSPIAVQTKDKIGQLEKERDVSMMAKCQLENRLQGLESRDQALQAVIEQKDRTKLVEKLVFIKEIIQNDPERALIEIGQLISKLDKL